MLIRARIKVFTSFPDFKLTILFVAYSAIIVLKIKIFPIMIQCHVVVECIECGVVKVKYRHDFAYR